MEVWKIILGISGANGLWKLAEILLKHRSDQKLKAAEASNLNASAQKQLVENWVQWSQTLERKVKEFETMTTSLQQIIAQQREQIHSLEEKVEKMEQENEVLKRKLNTLKPTTDE